MWYYHQVFSGAFIIGVLGNIVAALLGIIVGFTIAHKVYDLRAIHKMIKERTSKHRQINE